MVRHEEDGQAKNSEGFGVLDMKWYAILNGRG